MEYEVTNQFQVYNLILFKVNIVRDIIVDMSSAKKDTLSLTQEDNLEFNDFFEEEKDISENIGTYNTDIVESVKDTPSDLPKVAILQFLLHQTLSESANHTQIGKNVEEKSNDNLTKLDPDSKNDELIASQKSAQDKNSSKAVKCVIWYNLSKLLSKTNMLSAETLTTLIFYTNPISNSHQYMIEVFAHLTDSFGTFDIN